MSVDAPFTELRFPNIRTARDEQRDEQAMASGHAAGYAAGQRAASLELSEKSARLDAEYSAAIVHANARLDHAIGVLAAAAAALQARTLPVLTGMQDLLAASALELAEALLGSELSAGDSSASTALRRALSTADPALVIRVRLNPIDLAVLDDATKRAAGVTMVGDPDLVRGDAVTEFEVGYLDARLSSAVERARAAITGSTA
jgi:flagellar assembly protein FliH